MFIKRYNLQQTSDIPNVYRSRQKALADPRGSQFHRLCAFCVLVIPDDREVGTKEDVPVVSISRPVFGTDNQRRIASSRGTVGQASSMFLAMACLIPYNVYGDTGNKATYGAVAGLFLVLIALGW